MLGPAWMGTVGVRGQDLDMHLLDSGGGFHASRTQAPGRSCVSAGF